MPPEPRCSRSVPSFSISYWMGPRLLAMGYRQLGLGQRFSFLLIEPPLGATLDSVLRRETEARVRETLLRRAGALQRQIHEAGYVLRGGTDPLQAFVVCGEGGLALACVELLERSRSAGDPAKPHAVEAA